jgi:uncharacterized membrane protein YdbT with pleckstrin-like domain
MAPAAPLPAAPTDVEEEIWRGRFSGKAQAHWWFLWVLEIIGLLYLWFILVTPQQREGPVWKWVFLAAAGVPVVLIFWTWLIEKMGTRYRLTSHRLFKETGILMRHVNEVDLIRVDDVSVRQSLIQRIFNVGVVTVIAPTDQTEPRLELVGIANPIEVKEKIREQARKRRKGSLHVESL